MHKRNHHHELGPEAPRLLSLDDAVAFDQSSGSDERVASTIAVSLWAL